MERRPTVDTLRRPLLILAALFLLILGIRLLGVYPPILRRDPATIALQACRILDGERPIFFSGQAWMGAAGTYIEALLFKVFGANSLVMSLYAWACSALWILLSLLLAWRFFGARVATGTAALWLLPTPALLYWSSQARNDFHALFIATPLILLLAHDLVRHFRGGRGLGGRALLLGFVCGFSFWQNMGIGPCLVVTFAVIALHLGRAFWSRFVWYYAPGWLLGFAPVLYYNLTTDFVLTGQGGITSARQIARAGADFLTNVVPYFWGMPLDAEPRTPWRWALIFFLAWAGLMIGLYAASVYRAWRRREDILGHQLVLGLLGFQVFVPLVTEYGKSFATSGNPILFLTNLYSVVFVIPALVLARLPRAPRVLLALPLLIYAGNNVRNTRSVPHDFLSALRERGAGAIQRFPDPANPLIKFLAGKGLSQGYLESPAGNELNLAGLHSVEFSRPYQERVVEYALRTDAAASGFFWIHEDGVAEGLRMIGSSHESTGGGARPIYYDFRQDLEPEAVIEGYAVSVSPDPAGAGALSDHNADTAWSLPSPLPEAWIRFDFPQAEMLDRIALLPSDHRTLPAHLLVQTSDDGATWRTVDDWEQVSVFFWSVRHPFLKLVKPRCELALSRVEPVRHLRILVPAQSGLCSLREVYLYRRLPGGPPAVSVDEEVSALAQALAPLKATHQIVGDHYFMSYFKLAGFEVEFIPNRTVNNSGRRNPFLKATFPLDFSRPLALIAPKSHGPAVTARLDAARIGYERRQFAFNDLYVTTPVRTDARLYWSGVDLLATAVAPSARAR
ncbi:MAG TPA: discoidin domain-containing protein [Candidatus Methanoperedens sp.]|nr:discoidin domain-containing protein [Candidatus Methanoperedens sp.]